MKSIIQKDIEFNIDIDRLLKMLKVDKTSVIGVRAIQLAKTVECLVKPKFLIVEAEVNATDRFSFTVNNTVFNSKIVSYKLADKRVCYPFVITSGREIAEYMLSITDYLDSYIVDQIAYLGYLTALEKMQQDIKTELDIDYYISLSPGSIIDWDVSEVKKLFEVFGDEARGLDIFVLDSGMINPIKSVSGIIIKTDEKFSSCELCNKQKCPTRSAEYDDDKYTKMINL